MSIRDAIANEIEENAPTGAVEGLGAVEGADVQETPSRGLSFNFGWLKTETGPGEIEDYITHPLNMNGSRSMAQILRGVTGFAGNLKLAVIDIVMGVLNFSKERKSIQNVTNNM